MEHDIVVRGMLLGKGRITDVVVRGGKVVDISPARQGRVDLGSKSSIISPTLFDIQVNGGGGVSLQGGKVTPEDVRAVADWLAAGGVSQWIPTIITGPTKAMEAGCRAIAEAIKQDKFVGRTVAGIHIEGPAISPVDGPRGAHPKRHVRKPNLREFDRFNKASGGRILYVTVAPEVEGAPRYIAGLVKRGVTVSLGHHNASETDIARAVDAGAQLATHLGNGLAPTLNRHLNPLWPQLAEDHLAASLIADLHHLPPPVLKTFVRAKGHQNVIFTSDCVHLAGLKSGNYELAGSPVSLMPDGRVCLEGTDLLAGSATPLLQGVVNAARITDMSLQQAFASATSIPAKLLGVKQRFTLPSLNKKANFIVFEVDTSSEEWEAVVQGVFIDGEQRH